MKKDSTKKLNINNNKEHTKPDGYAPSLNEVEKSTKCIKSCRKNVCYVTTMV